MTFRSKLLVFFELKLDVFTARQVHFFLPRFRASRQPISATIEFKIFAREVVASVVIRAAKVKHVELESTLFHCFST